jgi:hypothetical protein
MDYIDEWQPKTTLYRHKASYNTEGVIAEDIGSTVKQVPGNPDYVLKKAKIGLFPWKPGSECSCQWCSEVVAEVEEKPKMLYKMCDKCDFEGKAKSNSGLYSTMAAHERKKHK